jgi:hypothetical protein
MNDSKLATGALAITGAVALIVVYVPLAWLVNGWALSVLWNWFIPPVFESAPTLSVWPAVGVTIVLSMLTNHVELYQAAKDPSKTGFWPMAIYTFTTPLWALLAGWLLKSLFL